MRTLTLVALVSVLPHAASRVAAIQTSAPASGPVVTLTDSTSVPMEVPNGRAIVTVTLNGRGPYRLAVETGSPNVLVSPRVVRDLALPATGLEEGDSVFRVDSLRIGTALIQSLPVGRDSGFTRLGVDGVLGLIAYRDVLLTVDYRNQRLSLARSSLPAPDGREIIEATRVGPFVGIPILLGDVKETGVIDTQGGIGFQATEEVAGTLTFQAPPRVVGRAIVGGGAPVEVKRGVLAGDVLMGQHRIQSPAIAVHTLPPGIPSRVTIGLEVLRHFAVAIDQRAMAVRLTRPDTTAIRL